MPGTKSALFGLVLGLLLTTTALSDEPPGDNALHGPVKHARACAGPAPEGEARCHVHVVMNESGQVKAAVTPSGYSPSDLRSAYNITGTGASSTTIAIVDAFGYPNAVCAAQSKSLGRDEITEILPTVVLGEASELRA